MRKTVDPKLRDAWRTKQIIRQLEADKRDLFVKLVAATTKIEKLEAQVAHLESEIDFLRGVDE